MNILLTGATGFTGSWLLAQMHIAGIRPRCLVRRSSDRTGLTPAGVELVEGDIGDPASLARALHGVDTLVNTASIGFGQAPVLVAAAERAGVNRAVFISTTAIFTTLNASSKAVRMAAEKCIRESRLDWTILRPTMIYGSRNDRNMARLIRLIRSSRLIPVIGSGEHLQQPVYVGDVAKAVLQALGQEVTVGHAYNIAGAAPLSFNDVIDTIARLMRRRVLKVHIPLGIALIPLQMSERAGVRLPVRSEQLQRLNEAKAFGYVEAAQDFGYAPVTFEEGITLQLREMGLIA